MHHNWIYLYDRSEDYAALMQDTKQYIYETMDNPIMIQDVRDAVEYRVFTNAQSKKERSLQSWWQRQATDELAVGAMLDMGTLGTLTEAAPVVLPLEGRLEEEE